MLDGRRPSRRVFVAVGARAVAVLVAASAAIVSGCANPVLDRMMGRSATEAPVLPANVLVSLSVVRQVFPMLTRSLGSGLDPTAPGAPRATRRSQFTDLTAMPRLTVAVSEYASEHTAFTAFTDYVEDLRYAPRSLGLGRPDVGEDALAAVTRPPAGPMGVTVAVSDARLIIQVKSTGFKYSRDHLERLITLARSQLSFLVSAGGAPR